jgi:hypothetical protein
MLWEPKVVQHTPKDKPDPRRATFDIPLNEDLFWLHLGPPRSWTPYMFDVAGTFPAHEATRERFRLDFDKIRHAYSLPYIVVWYRRVYLDEPGVSVAIRWYPHREEQVELVLPSKLPHKHATRYFTAGLRLLRDLENRGRPPGPAGYEDAQEFEDEVLHLIQTADRHGQTPTQRHIASLLHPILVTRNGATYSAASVDINIDSTAHLIRDHISMPWRELVRKARQSP